MILPRCACNNGNILINQSFLDRHPAAANRIRNVPGTDTGNACEKLLCNIKMADLQYVLQARLINQCVGILRHYPIPLHLQRADAVSGYKRNDFPIAEKITDEVPGLLAGPYPGCVQQDQLVSALLDFQL